MKILHTSDWHLGRTLYSKKERIEEHSAFLSWLLEKIHEESIDVLLIAGDIFDTASPSTTSQKMYYNFLLKARDAGCKHVVVIGGNHDSPSFLNAPKEILASLDIVVVGNATENIADEVIVIHDKEKKPLLIVCGVPFLRERDISRFVEGETYSDRSQRINETIKKHYEAIAEIAVKKRDEIGIDIPIIATGHLSVDGGKRNEDDGVRETYIGSIQAISCDIFPQAFDYVALGHYHIPSKIKEHIRYCGSPIPMGFGEANQIKCIYTLDTSNISAVITHNIPVFQQLESILGNKTDIENRLKTLKNENASVWVEITYTGEDIFTDLANWINQLVLDTNIEVLKIQNRKSQQQALSIEDTHESLEDLNPKDVFEKLLNKEKISDEQKQEMKEAYQEIITSINVDNN